jgi:hypothetical protein
LPISNNKDQLEVVAVDILLDPEGQVNPMEPQQLQALAMALQQPHVEDIK